MFQDSAYSSRRSPALALLCAAVTLLLAVVPSAASAAERPPFYRTPPTIPDGGPGTLIRYERYGFKGITRPPAGTVAWRVLYTSVGATGERSIVSGSLLLPPIGAEKAKGLVSVAVGTHGMGDACAPSLLLAGGAEPDLETMRSLLRRGYAVAVTDFQGLGTDGPMPFAVNTTLGRNVIDVIRAVRQIPDTGLRQDGPVAISGYSSGGGAAASAAEQAPTYAPELDLVGAIAGGTLSDPLRAVQLLDGNWFMGLALAGAIGYSEAYPELDLEPLLKGSGKWILEADTAACQEWVARFMFNRWSWYTTRNPMRMPEWRARMEENAVGKAKPTAPVYLYHGLFDEAVFADQTLRTRKRWCALGANVRWKLNPITEHFTTQAIEEPLAFRWLEERFLGRPAKGNC